VEKYRIFCLLLQDPFAGEEMCELPRESLAQAGTITSRHSRILLPSVDKLKDDLGRLLVFAAFSHFVAFPVAQIIDDPDCLLVFAASTHFSLGFL
jgi:hypothetical protein